MRIVELVLAFSWSAAIAFGLVTTHVSGAEIARVPSSTFGPKPSGDVIQISVRGKEGRVWFGDMAHLNKAKFDALGEKYPTRRFICGDEKENMSQASVVVSKSVIVIAAHAIYDEHCVMISEAAKCHLRDVDHKNYFIDLNYFSSGPQTAEAEGRACHLHGLSGQLKQDDWVVVRLQKPIPGVIPYNLEKPGPNDVGRAYTLVSRAANNFIDPRAPKAAYPNIQSCVWRNIISGPQGTFLMKTDCDTGFGMSMGPMLTGDNAIQGFHVALLMALTATPTMRTRTTVLLSL